MSSSTFIDVEVNGEARQVPERIAVDALLRHLGIEPGTVVVERNGTIVRRHALSDVLTEPGDVYELVHFVGGG